MASKRRSLSQVKNCGRKQERRQPVLQESFETVRSLRNSNKSSDSYTNHCKNVNNLLGARIFLACGNDSCILRTANSLHR